MIEPISNSSSLYKSVSDNHDNFRINANNQLLSDEIDKEDEVMNMSIKTVNKNESRRKSMQIDTTFDSSFEDNEHVEIKNATVCIIDICGFSRWCSNQIPYNIVHVMSKYNSFLSKTIDKYSLTKIELVGDSCMIVGGLIDDTSKTECTLKTIGFAVNILQNIEKIQAIFTDKHIGLRIGIHVSNVFGIMMANPRRFQLYGNDINVCSRLESSALKNTAHISLKTIMATKGLGDFICGPRAHCVRSTLLNEEHKGVGRQQSFIFHVKKRELLWYHNVNMKLEQILKKFNEVEVKNTKVIHDIPSISESMYSFFWDHVIIFIDEKKMLDEMTTLINDFRLWEKRRLSQNVTVVISSDLNSACFQDLCTVVTFDTEQSVDFLSTTLKKIIEENRNIDESRSALELS